MTRNHSVETIVCIVVVAMTALHDALGQDSEISSVKQLYGKQNLVAWCIVPFDGKKRGPAERAAMCARLGLKKIAYDWRQEHIPTFEQEILEYRKHGLEYFAFWDAQEEAFKLFEKYDLHPQIWKMIGMPKAADQEAKVKEAAIGMLPIVERTRKMGCKLGLYNHGSWAGEPENMVAVCEYLRKHHKANHVGVVYNMHHAHNRIKDFDKVLKTVMPYLLCLNLNGMTKDGDQRCQKILPLGEGEFDVALFKTIRESGYKGPIGIIGHTQDDVEQRLQDNLDGLEWIIPQLEGKPAGPKPKLRTWTPQVARPAVRNVDVTKIPGDEAYRNPPITVELRATLPVKDQYNILIASDKKNSGAHWEVFSLNGAGTLTVYTPGRKPDHIHTKAMICDNKPHNIAMIYEKERIRLFVDGKVVGDAKVVSLNRPAVNDQLAIGGLVEGSLGCTGSIDWVHIREGAHEDLHTAPKMPKEVDTTILHVDTSNKAKKQTHSAIPSGIKKKEFSRVLVNKLVVDANNRGDSARGLMAFAGAKSACLSCHKMGMHGGTVGPDLTRIGKERKPEEIVESILWPNRTVKPEFKAHLVVDAKGRSHRGYIVSETKNEIVLRDPTKGEKHRVRIASDDIDIRREVGTLMPDNLDSTLNETQLLDVISFLSRQGRESGLKTADIDSVVHHAMAHQRGAASFPFGKTPINPKAYRYHDHHVNRDRIYDYYGKQADHFRNQALNGKPTPGLLIEYPGLDGGTLGHWGNQNEKTWESGEWNQSDRGWVQSGVFRTPGKTVTRGVVVQLSGAPIKRKSQEKVDDAKQISCCFNIDTLRYEAVWQGGFVRTSSFRHGFLDGYRPVGEMLPTPAQETIAGEREYYGFIQGNNGVVFLYRIGDTQYFDSPRIKDGLFSRTVLTQKVSEKPFAESVSAPAKFELRWPETIETNINFGSESPYAIDTIELPFKNKWNALFFVGGVGFLPDGSALVSTMQGDVWKVTGLEYPSKKATWKRFASGLHHPLGIVVDKDGIFVLCRDQLVRLHDHNDDGEADFYECYSKAFSTSPAGHDFICGLVRDKVGNFYTASGNQGIVRISADGKRADVVATGFRNPDGIGLTANGMITVPCSEGEWTPASMMCAFTPSGEKTGNNAPFFGFRPRRKGQRPQLPLVYFPRGVDNSAGGQVTVKSDRWGPLKDQLIHLSFGTGSHFLILQDEIEGQPQGAVVPLAGDFASGVHRGKFNPKDGQLYVGGMQGWGSYTPQTGCFERVRYTGQPVQVPVAIKTYTNGILLEFSQPLERLIARVARNHFAQCWNYRYSQAYGSPEFSTRHFGMRGHDSLVIQSAKIVAGGKSLFLEIPELQPANQVHLRIQPAKGSFQDLFVTVHKLRSQQFLDAPGLKAVAKTIKPHPIEADLVLATKTVPNPFRGKIAAARKIRIETATNLSYATRSFTVKPGEAIEFTLANPDVVPHNIAFLKPGTLERVGTMANKLISDPEAAIRQYIPSTSDVLFYTDVVYPKEEFTIYFRAPENAGRYPYLCTFPGHWLVMNGEMIVKE